MQNPIRSRGIRSLGLIVVGALSLAVVGGVALTHATVPDAMWGWHEGPWNGAHMAGWGGWGWGTIVLGLLWMALLVVLPGYLVYWLASRSQTTGHTENSALAVLEGRYARDEIDEEEFDRRRAGLTPDDCRYDRSSDTR